jgi:TPR repeat protein
MNLVNKLICMLGFLLLVVSGCDRPSGRGDNLGSREITKWDYQEIEWDQEKDESMWGKRHVTAALKVYENGRWTSNEVVSLSHLLSVVGSSGWELVWVSPSGTHMIFKRPQGASGTFTFEHNIDFQGWERDHDAQEAAARKQLDSVLNANSISEPALLPGPREMTAEERAEAMKQRKLDTVLMALEFNRAQAATNNPFGLLRMGERYLAGDGVGKDVETGKRFLRRASAAGSRDAQEILDRMESK